LEDGENVVEGGIIKKLIKMNSEDYQKVKAVFQSVIEIEPPERTVFLNDVCRDDADLRREVERLLQEYDSDFLEEPAVRTIGDSFEKNNKIGHYEILKKLGAGGMGEVYLARDEQLGRKVALKMLAPRLVANEESRARFLREARLASSLDHPNICTIHEIGESENQCFISMQYVEGKTLSETIDGRALSLNLLLAIGLQIADALRTAHTQGIIHRDIKSANILINSRGQAKVLDFGLAKLLSADDDLDENLTQTGAIHGTPAYMSPEQACGEDLNHRSDIFSFGVVLYEMATGQLPFKKKSKAETMNAVINEPHKPIGDKMQGLSDLIDHALAKNPDERYQTMEELFADLSSLQKHRKFEAEFGVSFADFKTGEAEKPISYELSTESGTHSLKSIAVLPFANLSNDAENEYFCDGLAEELLNALAKIEKLRVAARTSAFSFKNKKVEVSQIGNALNVSTILEGSVRKSGNRLRIIVQLVNAVDGFQLWSERYEREMQDIFDVQDEITLAVVAALKVKLLGEEKEAILKRGTDDTNAFEAYLKGLFYANKYTIEGWFKAIEYFDEAVRIDEKYALALGAKAANLNYLYYFASLPNEEVIQPLLETIGQALALDENQPEAHLSLGVYYLHHERDFEKAERELKLAVELAPKSADAHHFYGLFLVSRERFEEALSEGNMALELDPLSLLNILNVGWIYWTAGRSDLAKRHVEKILELEPNFVSVYWLKGWIEMSERRFSDAVETFKKSISLKGGHIMLTFLGTAHGLAGNHEEALQIVNKLIELKKTRPVKAYNIARIYAGLGDMDNLYRWLEKSLEERNGELVYLDVTTNERNGSFWGKEFRADPRFESLLQRISSPAEGF